jgi:DNA-binding CsgD family transcriptional regulator
MTRILLIENENTLHWFESSGQVPEWKNGLDTAALAARLKQKEVEVIKNVHKTTPLRRFDVGSLLVLIPDGSLKPLASLPPAGQGSRLTNRQKQVLQALANGLSTKQIAVQLHLSERTVLMHVRDLKGRLGAVTREQVILKALSSGVL